MAIKQTNIDSLLEKGVDLMRQGAFVDAEKIFHGVLLKALRANRIRGPRGDINGTG